MQPRAIGFTLKFQNPNDFESMFTINEIYEYSSRVRRKFLEKLAELPWEEAVKNREASYYSMKNILIHIIDNEDWIVNWVVHNRATEYKRARKSEDYTSVQMIKGTP